MWNRVISIWSLIFCITTASSRIYFPEENDASNTTFLLDQRRNTNAYEPTVDGIIAKGISKLTMSFQKHLAHHSTSDNVLFAPVNIGGALALVLLASSGRTFSEIASILDLASGVNIHANSERVHMHIGRTFDKLDRSTSSESVEEVKLGTAVFVQEGYPIRNVFRQASEQIYRSEVLNVDFRNGEASKALVNAWVNQQTNGKIKTMLDENPSDATKVIIASALYFKAAWEKPFFNGSTKRLPFYINGRDQPSDMKIDIMTNGGLFPYYKDRTLDCEIMGFPYKENKSTLYVIMPINSDKQKLLTLQDNLTPKDLDRLADSTRYTQAVIGFPKMALESSLDLSETLKAFGANSLFNPREANLALLSPGPGGSNSENNLNAPTVGASQGYQNSPANQVVPMPNTEQVFFPRSAFPTNCTMNIDSHSNTTICDDKRFGVQVKRRNVPRENIDYVRQHLGPNENPGLYADKVLHKVFMEITESGTEAAAATSVSLTRGGDITMFRVDQPFIFFIRNHETRLILFWGSVTRPTPNYAR